MSIQAVQWIPWLPASAAAVCGLCCTKRSLAVWAAPVTILALFAAFVISVMASTQVVPAPEAGHAASHTLGLFQWMSVGGFSVDFSYFVDPLTIVMLFVVCGIGTLVAIYASGYMAGDRGYARFFAGVCLFIFAMTTLVMADNLVLLYLGWEGVGLCSYLLIGYYYQKPSAVAAAKKAFIVNRIGDLGFALGIFLCWYSHGSVQISEVLDKVAHAVTHGVAPSDADVWIPFLLMLGAFGKSAQLPLYVWLPDAMEGPTPVSALIHAATMVTAGVYMIARLQPLFAYSPYALPAVALVGGATALFAGTIALCQYDIKRIYAYSTVSQLGYMFLGVGALSSVGGVFHLFTHAFFKALLFLTAGSVMHALAGQLDLRHMSGLRKKMPVTCVLMLLGCLALAGFPFTAGFYSKDMILAAAMGKGLGEHGSTLFLVLAVMGLFTAFLTAYYTFRLWFRVFMGPTRYDMGDEHHGADDAHATPHGSHTPGQIKVEHHHDAHEVSWLMNAPLVVLAVGAIFAGYFCHGWIEKMVSHSTAGLLAAGHGAPTGKDHHGPSLFGGNLHTEMMIVSSVIGLAGISVAAWFHWLNRPAADRVAAAFPGVVKLLEHKYYVDEIYDLLIVRPLRTLGSVLFAFDRLVIDGLVSLVGLVPRLMGMAVQPAQRGVLQGYGLGMAAGAAVVVFLLLRLMNHG